MNKQGNIKKILIWGSSSFAVITAIISSFFIRTEHRPDKINTTPSSTSTKKSETATIFKTSEERKAFAKLLLRYQLHYARGEWDKALAQLDRIAERWPEYPEEKLDKFRTIIEKKRKKVEGEQTHSTKSGVKYTFKTAADKKEFARLILAYQFYYAKKDFERASKKLNTIEKTFPDYPKNFLESMKRVIHNKVKKLEAER